MKKKIIIAVLSALMPIFCLLYAQYFSNTEASDKANDTISIKKKAIFNFNCFRLKFNKKLDKRIMPNPTYCIILNFSPTMKYAKIGTDTFPRENNATVINVSTLRKAI